ncbi:MAG: hypothetical protein IJE72_01610, partial [Clostridia bacterium]|nr:hypothetical protein [Clostridia bacterium]
MSKIKRALSAFLAIAIVFGMFSCLAPTAAPIASAEGATTGATTTVKSATAANDGIETLDKVTGIMSYNDLVKDYGTATGADGLTDGFIYVASEYYEYDESGKEVLTDYNVQPGEKLNVKVYIKSNMYTGEGYIISFYDNSVWDVKIVADGVTPDANGYTNNFASGVVNS